MKRTRNRNTNLDKQIEEHIRTPQKKKKYEGNFKNVISTGSTLLDLAISGGRVRGGGLPSGILVEAFGPSSSGKTVLLCEIAGAVQRKGGKVMFHDPEARLDKQFARMFDLKTDAENMVYGTPDKVPEVFQSVRDWEVDEKLVNGAFADSLAALSTELEMEKDEGDKMGMRRAKEFSEELRRTCRIIKKKNILMVASNQVREDQDAAKFSRTKYKSSGGYAIGFYSSLRLRFSSPTKIYKESKFRGKKIKAATGIETTIEVFKSSIWKPYRTAPIIIDFSYGIDDIQSNLKFIKDYSSENVYTLGDRKLGATKEKAIKVIEEENLEAELREEVIDLWEEIEKKFEVNRKKKER
jgi:protein RecA